MDPRSSRFKTTVLAVMASGFLLTARLYAAEPLDIRNGERILLIGDLMHGSRFAAHPDLRDPELIAAYFLSRFPDRKISFIKVADESATTAGVLANLDAQALVWKPTLVIIDRGLNDIGAQSRAPQPDFGVYRPAMEKLVARLRKAGARVVLCSPTPMENGSTPEDLIPPNDGLAKLVNEAQAIAETGAARFVDVFWPLIRGAAQARQAKPAQNFMCMGCYFHQEGHYVLNAAILEGMGVSAEISDAAVDAKSLTARTNRCQITAIEMRGATLRFLRQDACALMPMADAAIGSMGAKYNRAMLKITGLAPGTYALTIDGVKWGPLTHAQLGAGVNLGSRPSPLYAAPYAEYLKRIDAAQGMMTSVAAIRSYRLPGWIKQPDFEKQREAELARKMAELGKAQARLGKLFQPKPHQFEISPAKNP